MNIKNRRVAGALALAVAATVLGQATYTPQAKMYNESDLKTSNVVTEPAAWGATPNEAQLKYHNDELAAFCHFGMNTFTDKEWGDGKESPSQFSPTGDVGEAAKSWVKALKDAGFEKLIVTAKHNDGFCIWPSEYTKHDVENSPYKGDVLAEISAACSEYDMDMGLYLSPWDVNAESYGYYDKDGNALLDENGKPVNGMTMEEVKEKDALDYNDYYVNQIEEIVTNPKYGNKGRFTEWWMDGAKGEGGDAQEYDMDRILKTIKENEPGILIFGGGVEGGIHWIGNEKGIASNNTWAKVDLREDGSMADGYSEKDGFTYGIPEGKYWSVPESDVSITPGWFYHDGNLPKSMSQLSSIYFSTIGNGSPLLLNVAPNKSGDIDGTIYSRLREFNNARTNTFKEDLTITQNATATASKVRGLADKYSPNKAIDGDESTYWAMDDEDKSGVIEVTFDTPQEFDVVSIQEYIEKGQRVKEFNVKYLDTDNNWQDFGGGQTIGAKKLIRTKPVTAKAIQINITDSFATPLISEIGVYKSVEGFEINDSLPAAYTKFEPKDVQLKNGRKPGDDSQGYNYAWEKQADGSYTNTGEWAAVEYEFTGSYFALVGAKGPNYGGYDIYVDGKYVTSGNASSNEYQPNQVLYESSTLSKGKHTIKLLTTSTESKPVNFSYGYYLGINDNGLFEIERDSYQVTEGDSLKVKLKRTGGTEGEVSVRVTTPPGMAVQGQYYEDINEVVTFKDGESSKYITLKTHDNLKVQGNKDFYLEISSPINGAQIGLKYSARILIVEDDVRLEDAINRIDGLSESWYKAEGWGNVEKEYLKAKDALTNDSLSEDEKMRISNSLIEAYSNLESIVTYSKRNPMILSTQLGQSKIAESELGILDSSHENIVNNNYLKIVSDKNFSKGRLIDKIKSGNTITMPIETTHTGEYEFDFSYKTNIPMILKISGEGIENKEIDLETSEELTNKKVNLYVSKEGLSDVVLTATEKDASQSGELAIDNILITLNEISKSKITGIEIANEAIKKVYAIGDELDLEGLKVLAKYEDGTEEDITNKITVSGFDSKTAGNKVVTLHYGDFTTSYTVMVKSKSDDVVDKPVTDPSKPEEDNEANTGDNNGNENGNDSDSNVGNNGNIETGDSSAVGYLMGTLLLSGAAIGVIKRKRK
ncbi:alpha-L-fucosidase [Clostridium chauvoei]|uniref:alpha-L-fucosidase n=1 Tax=Clostridium chauvoei TaxID=46867 RepID=UPI001C84223A|nr:alpha-L-fucosidase [Clostridium chauvoei]MBX7322110.1 alpha-L-fucosidase [Clostridium chauvoei]